MNIGKMGEDKAAQYLIQNGYKVICRNFRIRTGEIDIIAMDPADRALIVCVEVKTRRGLKNGYPAEAVNSRKQKRIQRTAEVYAIYRKVKNPQFRMDVIEILLLQKKYYIRHMKNAF